jgi:hypothetical protein
MSILAFTLAVAFMLVVLFVAVSAARRDRPSHRDVGSDGWYADGGAGYSDHGAGADCGGSSDGGGGGCDGGSH